MAQTLETNDAVGRLINLVPVGLKEAAIDSPTSRASIVHYGEQLDHLERWLDDYMKSTNRLVAELFTLESILTNFTSHAVLPATVAESMLDHDYDVLAMKKYSEGAKGFWMSIVSVVKRLPALVADPIRGFIQNDLRAFKDAKRTVEVYQKNYDTVHAKYAGLIKTKEPSFLREEAFQLHEARKLYLKAHLDFFALAPQFRFALDKLLVKIFFEQWKEMRNSRDNTAATFQRSAADMERVKGWVSEMETSERTFRKELHTARKQLEDAAELNARPSRELDDYSPFSGPPSAHTHSASGLTLQRSPKKTLSNLGEKQGWLYLRTYSGRPTRTVWVKRWAFLRNGVIGWLLQNARGAGVEETERIGVLLCNVRPAVAEERRFCFELKTNRHTIVLQAETQAELLDWTTAIETAKSKALEDPAASDSLATNAQPHSDPAFSISMPPVPQFGHLILSSTDPGASGDDSVGGLDRSSTLPVPANDHFRETSVDLGRRSTAILEEGTPREPTSSRLMSKLDLHRKPPPSPSLSPSPSAPIGSGGIASLIAASHGSMPVGPSLPVIQQMDPDRPRSTFTLALRDMPPSTLAPSTLANVPTPTNMSKPAVVVAGERGISAASDKAGIPNSLLANMWGSTLAAYVNRLDKSEQKVVPDGRLELQPSPLLLASTSPPKSPSRSPLRGEASSSTIPQLDLLPGNPLERSRSASPTKRQLHATGFDNEAGRSGRIEIVALEFPNYYPLQLKTQDAQFRLLFPTVKRDERLVMVFRATWNPNDQQDFPGRVYVTAYNIYFYSNHLGLVLTSTVSLSSIDEATGAPGRECDFIFLHMKEGGVNGTTMRITIKIFLEPLKLLQRRINFLIRNSSSSTPASLEEVIKTLLRLESDAPDRSPSLESWEDVAPDTPVDAYNSKRRGRSSTITSELRAPTRMDRSFALTTPATQAETVAKFKLPAQAVKYTPPGNLILATEQEFDVSPKALFHVMFGDRSILWQLLQHERQARNLKQGPWTALGEGRLRRDFEFEIPTPTILNASSTVEVRDYQVLDVNSDHLCYVVTDKRTPWHLPLQSSHRLISKIVITHVAKGKCKLAVFIRIEWLRTPWRNLLTGMVERQALADLESDALDLVDLVGDQVRKLGAHSRTKKAITIFGQVGHSTEIVQSQLDASAHALEIRRVPIRRGLTSLLVQHAVASAQSLLGLVLETLIDLFRWAGKTLSAHRVLVAILLLSAAYNTYHTSKASWSWYRERNAARFMRNLGVSPDTVMSKAVYIADIDALVDSSSSVYSFPPSSPSSSSSSSSPPNKTPSNPSSGISNPCYTIFSAEYRLHDIDTPILSVNINTNNPSSSSHSKTPMSTLHAARRVQRTRQRLGRYRHDLLVGLRVVDRVEREVLRGEFEEWVRLEAGRCRVVEKMDGGRVNETLGLGLGGAGAGVSGGSGGNGGTRGGMGMGMGMGVAYEEYCRSCEDEVGRLGL